MGGSATLDASVVVCAGPETAASSPPFSRSLFSVLETPISGRFSGIFMTYTPLGSRMEDLGWMHFRVFLFRHNLSAKCDGIVLNSVELRSD